MAKVSGGQKLEAALRKMAKSVSSPGTLRVGFLEGSTGSDGMSLPLRAALNEYGVPSRGQPPRPFFRNMVAAKKGEWPAAVAAALKANDLDATKALHVVGAGIESQLVKSIHDLVSPPLAASTIARKGFDKPLIEHGEMWQSVNHEVV